VGRAARRRAEQRRAAPARPSRAPQTPPKAPSAAAELASAPANDAVREPPAADVQTATVGPAPVADTFDGCLVTVGQLAALHAERLRLDAELDLLVDQLAARGVGWGAIGRALGISRQGARQRYG